MSLPKIEIDVNKIRKNTEYLTTLCKKNHIQVAGVTKVFCAMPEVVEAMIHGGIAYIADSRIENLKPFKNYELPKILLRLPMISEAKRVVEYADISLNSELDTIRALNKEARQAKLKHQVILMIDLGDLREGFFGKEDLYATIRETMTLDHIEIIGIGTNLTCYGGVVPTKEILSKLVTYKEEIETDFGIKLKILSGGNSSSLHLIEKGTMPEGINHLRLGEAIVLGRETAFGLSIDNTYEDCFRLQAEIIELKSKPSLPVGEIGMDAFGNKPSFVDRGIRKRAILAIGKQDVSISDLIPYDREIYLLGMSSDHLIVDVTDSNNDYRVGDSLSFTLTYGGILSTMTSHYIHKYII